MKLESARLTLVAATPELSSLELGFLSDPVERPWLEEALGAQIEAWPPEFHGIDTCTFTLAQLNQGEQHVGWWQWYVLLKREAEMPVLVGVAGFKGPQDPTGQREIGYSVEASFRNQGIASEAVQLLTDWAFAQREVREVILATLDGPEQEAGVRVAEKTGYSLAARAVDEETGEVLLIYRQSSPNHTSRKSSSSSSV